jgi:phosphate-selective porin OprO/OprP
MKSVALPCLLLFSISSPAIAQSSMWPPMFKAANGGELSVTGNLAYDLAGVSGKAHGKGPLDDGHGWRRQEVGIAWKQAGQYELFAGYDLYQDSWQDVGIRAETAWLFGRDFGKLRLGQSKLAVGFEGATASRSGSFIEGAMLTQAFYESRRTGLDWAYEAPTWVGNAGYYFSSDLSGNNKGQTVSSRLAWTPVKRKGQVIHLGLSASNESPDGETNGHGQWVPTSARWRARAGTTHTDSRLVDSGALRGVEQIQRRGVEALWIQGPWSLQGEYQQQLTVRDAAQPGYRGHGSYVTASWLLTGESRPYSSGNVGNPKPLQSHGAVELLMRYDQIDLDDAGIAGGHASSWTLGGNWYLGKHFKLQANYIRAEAKRATSHISQDTVTVRTQLHF